MVTEICLSEWETALVCNLDSSMAPPRFSDCNIPTWIATPGYVHEVEKLFEFSIRLFLTER